MDWLYDPDDVSLGDLGDVDLAATPAEGATTALVEDPETPGLWIPGTVEAGGGGGGGDPVGGHAETIGDGTETEFVVTHGLVTTDVVVQLWDLTGTDPTLATGDADSIEATDVDEVTITFSSAPASDAYRVVVLASGASSGGGGGGGGGLIAETRVTGSAASELLLTWNTTHRRVRLTAWVRSDTQVAVSADNLFVQVGDDTALDTGATAYDYYVRDFLGNIQQSTGDSTMWASRLGVVASHASPVLFSRVELEFHDADQTAAPMRMRVGTQRDGAPLDPGRRAWGWGQWLAPTGPMQQVKMTLQAGSFVVDSEAYIEALA